ncbi:MAG: hypothetical protein H0V70_00075 [Ktedonobacteraceae bacterium]|nr:hypothetical protein [Ktedonobacteraceae bacterium]
MPQAHQGIVRVSSLFEQANIICHPRIDIPGICVKTLVEQCLPVFIEIEPSVRIWLDPLSTTIRSIETGAEMVV